MEKPKNLKSVVGMRVKDSEGRFGTIVQIGSLTQLPLIQIEEETPSLSLLFHRSEDSAIFSQKRWEEIEEAHR